jgi:hypothetical protein
LKRDAAGNAGVVDRLGWLDAADQVRAMLDGSMLARFIPATLGRGMQSMIPAPSRSKRVDPVAMLRRRVGKDFADSLLALRTDVL